MNICQRTECAIEFEPTRNSTGKYCSRSCAAKINNTRYPKRSPGRVECEVCKNQLHPSNKDACSIECRTILRRQRFIERWAAEPEFGSAKSGALKSPARNYLLEKAGYRCTRCGWSEISPYVGHGKPILTIDHIDGNWKNNSVDNLVVLCYNCHTLTPTFGSLNTKSAGRRGTYNRIKGVRA